MVMEMDGPPVEAALEPEPEPESPVIFDPDGNLTLLVGPSKQSFRVCSRTISRASPVFNRMLKGPWVEAKQPLTEDWTIELPEDDADALALVLHIIHSHFDLIKPDLNISELFQVCVVVNKYDLVHVLRPWAGAWCAAIEADLEILRAGVGEGEDDEEGENEDEEEGADLIGDNDDRLLWVAWTLGHETMFTRTTVAVLADASTHSTNDSSQSGPTLVTQRSHIKDEAVYVSSIGILDDITLRRLDIIKAMRGALQHIMDKLFSPVPKRASNVFLLKCGRKLGKRVYAHDMDRDEILDCRCFMLGSFIRALNREGFFPLPAAENITESVASTKRKLQYMPFDQMEIANDRRDRHFDCDLNRRVSDLIKGINLNFKPPAKYIDHLSEQRRKSGLPEPANDAG